MISFPPFRLDPEDERLWRGSTRLTIRRKPFAILRYLAQHPNRLVTQEELLSHVWGDVVVSESAIRSHLHDLRQVLGDGVIETVIGRGYRFIAAIAEPEAAPAAATAPAPAVRPASRPATSIVGRAAERATLRDAFERATAGERQIVFVTGEPGLGKTTLTEAFLDELADRGDVLVGRGQGIEQHGTPEAYLPVIVAVRALALGPHRERVVAALATHAPAFLLQLPDVAPDARRDELERRARAGNEARMVRELATALEALGSAAPLVLALEDLQWSDAATIDLLAMLGRRREGARLLVIVTARRAEAQTTTHPLNRVMRELVAREGARAVPLDRFTAGEVAGYFDLRFAEHALSRELVAMIHRVTDGTPLFVVAMVDDLVGRGMIAEVGGRWSLVASLEDVAAHRPDGIKQLVDIRLDRLADLEQRVLEAASVIGASFSTGAIAAALELLVEPIDDLCDQLARRGDFLRADGIEEWPDGSSFARYAFDHGIYQDVCVERTSPARRQRWHRLIGERLEAAYGARADEIAPVLAHHYDRGHALLRAAHHFAVAATRMARRFARRDATALFRRGVEVLARAPETRERDEIELRLLAGMNRIALRSGESAATAPIERFERHVGLARRVGGATDVFGALIQLAARHIAVAEYQRAAEVAAELVAMADRAEGLPPGARAHAAALVASADFHRGAVVQAHARIEAALPEILDASGWDELGLGNLATAVLGHLALAEWLIGDRDRALALAERAVAQARTLDDPAEMAVALVARARVQYWRGDPPWVVGATAQEVLRMPAEPGVIWSSEAALLEAWARSHGLGVDGCAAVARSAEDALRAFGGRALSAPVAISGMAAVVADIFRRAGRVEHASFILADTLAFARARGERLFEPELLRIRGELLEVDDAAAAERLYDEAIEQARAMGSPALEARAAASLARLQARRGR